MPYVAPIVAHVDASGNLRCGPCNDAVPMRPDELPRVPMHADNSAIDGQPCNGPGCDRVFTEDRQTKVHVPA